MTTRPIEQTPATDESAMPATPHGLRSRHLLGIDGLERRRDRADPRHRRSDDGDRGRPIKKVPTLRGRTVVNLFFEPSTRTRTSFEVAEKRLSADTLSIAVAPSSVTKGETLLDTVRNLEAMAPDMIVMRHASSGAPHLLARLCRSAIINAGDGMHEHPTQALLDAFTIRAHKGRLAGPQGRHRRRSAAQPRAAIEHPAAEQDGRGGVGLRPVDVDAAGLGRLGVTRHHVGRRSRRRQPTSS